MTEMDDAADRSALVPGAHRLIRAVARTEGPFSGALVAHGGSVAVCVDAVQLTGWSGWALSGADHVCGVIDVRRRADGHDALLPWCPERVEAFLGRRRAAEVPLAPGEIGTLVVSLLRGVRELEASRAASAGDWWLTGDGRPLFVHGDGGEARARTGALVERVIAHAADRSTARVLEEIATALRDRRHHVDDDARWEAHLFSTAAPRALRLDVFAPEKAADLATRSVRQTQQDARRSSRRLARLSEAPAMRWPILGALRSEVHERLRAWMSQRSRRLRPGRGEEHHHRPSGHEEHRPHTRRRMLILAGSLAAGVLIVGLIWPEDAAPEPAGAAHAARDSAESLVPARETAGATDASSDAASEEHLSSQPGEGQEALLAVPFLLDAVAACVAADVESCPDALTEGLDVPADGLAVQGSQASSANLVDDYGDVAVIKLAAVDPGGTAPEQMLVIERREQKWLVRDIYDVAHQPD